MKTILAIALLCLAVSVHAMTDD